MPDVWKRIVCPVDLDADSSEVLSLARTLAERNAASVCLLYVAGASLAGPSEQVPDWEHQLRSRLEKLGRQWFADKVPYDVVLWSGDPAPAILGAAEELHADLIVMASRRRGIDRLILGSVAARVIRESPVPVLAIRPKVLRYDVGRY